MRARAISLTAISVTVLTAMLLIKFFWPLVHFGVPLGYDVGIYRFLFLRHAEAFPPFIVAAIPDWARGHPLGLFFFSTLLLRLGVPVDWLVGWIWNLFPVILALTLAFVIARREGKQIGVLVLLCTFLSVAFYDGFAAMYWKTFLSLFFFVLAIDALDHRKWLTGAIFGILTVVTHHQTGLIFGLAYASWMLLLLAFPALPVFPVISALPRRSFLLPILVGVSILLFGLLWYAPIWHEAVTVNIAHLLAGPGSDNGGSFPPLSFYVANEGLLLLIALYGFVRSVSRERGTLWQCAVLWCALFVLLRLLFYRRFFLQLDFFLLPFAALGIADLWRQQRGRWFRGFLILLLTVQGALSVKLMGERLPSVDAVTMEALARMEHSIPKAATVVVPENVTAPMLRGWLPHQNIIAPGLFADPWTYDAWRSFILGSHAERQSLLRTLHPPVELFVAPFFHAFYGPAADRFLADPCFAATADPFLYHVTCLP